MKIDKNKIIFNLLLLFVISLFTPQYLFTNIVFALISILVLSNSQILIKFKLFFKTPMAYVLISFYLLHIISLIYSNNIEYALRVIEIRAPLLLFPLILYLIDFEKKDINKLLLFTAYSTVLAAFVGLIYSTYFYFYEIQDTGYFYNDNLVKILGFQAVYFAIYVNFAVIILLKQIINSRSKLNGILNIGLVIFMVIISFLLASRTSIILLFLILFFVLAYYILKRKKYLLGFASIVFTVVFITALIIFFPKTINRFESIKNLNFDFENTNSINHYNMENDAANWNGLTSRMAIWQCAIESVSENLFFGSGVGDYKDDLHEKFERNNFYFGLESNYGVHNNYLQVLLMFGVFGLFIFSIYLFYPLIISLKNSDYIYFGFLVIFIFAFLTEDVLSRNEGVMLFSFFNSIFAFNSKKISISA